LDNSNQGSQSVDVIVQYKTSPGTQHFDRAKKYGATLKTSCGPSRSLADNDSDIAYVSPDRPLHAHGYPAQFLGARG
jgi:hypothetical protein